ncbi:MAG: DMT family transporter [Scytolyngbya sp. HA4215-MV1]|jgi:transporter family-2 protein|nr:DMT family transporter [Scytolyngbya sp. HA4215-MV1]
MNSRTIYLLAALLGGTILPVQVAINTLLRRYVGEPMQVTFISYLAGTLASLVLCFLRDIPFLLQRLWLKPPGRCGLVAV